MNLSFFFAVMIFLCGCSMNSRADTQGSDGKAKPPSISQEDMEVINNLGLLQEWDILDPKKPDFIPINPSKVNAGEKNAH